jgi:hypothetical protein
MVECRRLRLYNDVCSRLRDRCLGARNRTSDQTLKADKAAPSSDDDELLNTLQKPTALGSFWLVAIEYLVIVNVEMSSHSLGAAHGRGFSPDTRDHLDPRHLCD